MNGLEINEYSVFFSICKEDKEPKKIRLFFLWVWGLLFFFSEEYINKLWKLIVTSSYRCQNYK